jgi:hypothetical protein
VEHPPPASNLPNPSWLSETFFGTAQERHLPVGWDGRAEIGQIWAENAPSNQPFWDVAGSKAKCSNRIF